jgi:hypothetical protein
VRRIVEFGLEVGQLGAALPGARRVAGLGHEALDHAVEDDPVIEPLPHEGLDPLDMMGRPFGHQPDQHAPAVRQVEYEHVLRIVRGVRVDGIGDLVLGHELVDLEGLDRLLAPLALRHGRARHRQAGDKSSAHQGLGKRTGDHQA